MDAVPYPRRWGAYVLIRPLGGGGMGDVYLALHGRPGREKLCVIKRLTPDTLESPDRLRRFQREAEIARTLAHGAIAQTLAVDEVDGEPYIAQEFIEGRNITQLVASARSVDDGRIPREICIHIVREIARALAYAHGAGVVHRDVAPDNVMVTFDGEVRLIDFGIARGVANPSLTTPGLIVGRLSYSAPEVLAGERADRRADVYAAGVVLWELLTGRAPAVDERDAPPAPSSLRPDISAEIDAVVLKAIAAEPAKRFASAEDLQRALGPLIPSSFVGEEALKKFVGRCYDVEVLRRHLADEVAEAKALLIDRGAPPVAGTARRDGAPRIARTVYVLAGVAILVVAAAVLALARPGSNRSRATSPDSIPTPATPSPPPAPVAAVQPPPEIATPTAPIEAARAAKRPPSTLSASSSRRSTTGTPAAVLLDRALDSLTQGEIAAAERAARDALPSSTPLQKARAHVILGKAFVLRGQPKAAAEEFTDALELDPANEAAAAALARLRRGSKP